MIGRLWTAVVVLATAILPPATAVADEPAVAVRDERIDLNITERRIDRGPYETSLQVGIDRPLFVRVGVALSTNHITVILRGVRGNGRFHGDLTRLTHILAAHRVAP